MQQRVLQVLNGIGTGGIEKYVLDLMKHIDHNKYIFDFLLRKRTGDVESIITKYGSKIYYIESPSTSNRKKGTDVYNFFLQHPEYQTIHIHYAALEYITVLKAAKRSGVKTIILHSHGSSRDTLRRRVKHKINRFRTRSIPTCRLACSDKAAKWMFGSKNYTFIKNGIDTDIFKYNTTSRDLVRKKLGIENKYVWGHVGRLCETKNQKFLLKVFASYANNHPNSVLLLIGEGSDYEDLRKIVEDNCLTDQVLFLGYRNDVADIMCAMDIMVFPSLSEGFCIALIEAQCSGLPCVISDTIPNQIVLTDCIKMVSLKEGVNVWLDAIETVNMENREKYARIIAEKGFDIKSTTREVTDIYDEITARKIVDDTMQNSEQDQMPSLHYDFFDKYYGINEDED